MPDDEFLDADDEFLDAKAAADLIGFQPGTLRRMAFQRRIRSFKVLGALRFKRSDIEALIVERPARSNTARRKNE